MNRVKIKYHSIEDLGDIQRDRNSNFSNEAVFICDEKYLESLDKYTQLKTLIIAVPIQKDTKLPEVETLFLEIDEDQELDKDLTVETGAVILPQGLERLTVLNELNIICRKATFQASQPSIHLLRTSHCSRLVFEEGLVFPNLEEWVLTNIYQNFSFDKSFKIEKLKTIMPNLRKLKGYGRNADNFIQGNREVLLEMFPGLVMEKV